MPTYTYQCKECKYETDVKHRMTEEPQLSCPECEHVLRRIVRAVSFQLKGSGWFGKSKDN